MVLLKTFLLLIVKAARYAFRIQNLFRLFSFSSKNWNGFQDMPMGIIIKNRHVSFYFIDLDLIVYFSIK